MISVIPYATLGHVDHGWLNAHHHFSFASYHNEKRMSFGVLRVVNDDAIKAGAGFDMHPHKDMEIITFVRKGAITHRDSNGNKGKTSAGDVQVMSAGSGIYHSEFNLESEDTQLYQIWIYPKEKGIKPRWDQKKISTEPLNGKLHLLVSGREKDQDKGALYIHQDAAIYGGRINKGQQIKYKIVDQVYLLVSKGEIRIAEKLLTAGDGAEIVNEQEISIYANKDTELVLLDVPN